MLHDSLNHQVNIYVTPKNMLHMLYSHNTLKKVSVQNRKEETAMNSLREISPCYLHLPRESHYVDWRRLGGQAWNWLRVLFYGQSNQESAGGLLRLASQI